MTLGPARGRETSGAIIGSPSPMSTYTTFARVWSPAGRVTPACWNAMREYPR
jgi:hypothetical protein